MQVLYYTPSNVQSIWDPKLRKHVVLSKDIPFFVSHFYKGMKKCCVADTESDASFYWAPVMF